MFFFHCAGTNTSTFAEFRACKCLDGFHRYHLFEKCIQCPKDGLECKNDYATLKEGYWWNWPEESPTHKELYKNFTRILENASFSPKLHMNYSSPDYVPIYYRHKLPLLYKCPRHESCLGGLDSTCADGYEGPLCEVCSVRHYKWLKRCEECPTKTWTAVQLSLVTVVILIVVLVVVWTSRKKNKDIKERSSVDIILGRLKIVIGFYQVTSGILEAFSYIKWPDSLAYVGKYSEVLQLNLLQIAPVQCVFPNVERDTYNAFASLYVTISVNAFATIVAFACYGLSKFILSRKPWSQEKKLKKASHAKELIYRNLFFFLFVTYLTTCSKTVSVLPLACRSICYDQAEQNCRKFLRADYSIECANGFKQKVIVAYCAMFYIILLPTTSLVFIYKQRRAHPSVEKDSDKNTHNSEIFAGLRFIYENYNDRSWYWELIETFRKVVLTSGLILVESESRSYIGLACITSGIYTVFFAYKKPMVDPFENKLMLSSLTVTFVNLVLEAVSRIPKEIKPSPIDQYEDNIVFEALVFGANSLVIGFLVGEPNDILNIFSFFFFSINKNLTYR